MKSKPVHQSDSCSWMGSIAKKIPDTMIRLRECSAG
jgi:hypothetical protein